MATSFIKLHGLMVKAVECHAISPWFKSHQGHNKFPTFVETLHFFNFFQKSNFQHKKLPPLKPILTLQTWGQKCFVSELEPFEITDFDLGHPVNAF